MKPLWIVHTSESRKPLFDGWFMPTFTSSGLLENTELVVYGLGVDSLYGQLAFEDGMQARAEHFLDACRANEGRLIVSSGDDMCFYGSADDILSEIHKSLGVNDFCNIQDARDVLCACLICAISSPKTVDFLAKWVASRAEMPNDPGDQTRFNILASKSDLRFGRLPKVFWTHGQENETRFIDDVSVIKDPPQGILVHHANYAILTEVKVKLLEEVKQRVDRQKSLDISKTI